MPVLLSMGLCCGSGCQFDPGAGARQSVDGPVDTGADQVVASNTRVALVGVIEDRSLRGAALDYEWRQVDGPAVEIAEPHAAITSFVAPEPAETAETLVFELAVTSGDEQYVSTHRVTVLDADEALLDPMVFVDGGSADDEVPEDPADSDGPARGIWLITDGDVAAAFGETVTLSAAIKPLTRKVDAIKWRQIAGNPVELSGTDTLSASFVAPARTTSIIIRLTVVSGEDVRSADLAVYVTPRGAAGR